MRKPLRALGQQVGRLRHRLHAAADRDLEVAGAHRLVDHPDGAHARGAHLVDRLRGHLDRDPGLDLRLARRDLALAGLQHGAHHDVLDLLGRDVRAVERLADGYTAEMRGGEGGQTPAQLADRRASAAQDHGSRHACESINVPRMRVTATTDAPPATDADTIVVGVFEDEGIAHDHGGVLQALVDSGEAKRGLRKLAVTHAEGRRYIVAGLGGRSDFDPEQRARGGGDRRSAARRSSAPRRCAGRCPHHVSDAHVGALVEGTLLAAYTYREYKERRETGGIEALILSAHHDVSAPAAVARRSPRQSTPRATCRTARPTC